MSQHHDIVVIGGGIVGLGIAWRLAEGGRSVSIVDPAPGHGASHVAAGLIAPVTEVAYGEESLAAIHVESAARWPALAADLEAAAGEGVDYRQAGTLVVGFDGDDVRTVADLTAFQRSLDLVVEPLTSRECREREPGLSPRIRGGAFVPGDHQVDNRAVTRALLVACERASVQFVREAAVSLDCDDTSVRSVKLADAVLEADTVIVAAGAWSGGLAGLPAEVVPPVRPVKGQILRFRGDPSTPVLDRPVRGIAEGKSVYVVPRSNGEVVVGATVEEQGFDTEVTGEGMRTLLNAAFALLPEIDQLTLVESSAGLRPGTPDNAPLLGPTAIEGLVMATGHYRHGFLMLPLTVDAIEHVMVKGELPVELSPLAAVRFGGGRP